MATEHRTAPAHFEAVASGRRLFMVCPCPDLAVGDVLVLREWYAETEEYTGRYLVTEVTYVTPSDRVGGLADGHVAVGLGSHDGTWGIEVGQSVRPI